MYDAAALHGLAGRGAVNQPQQPAHYTLASLKA